MRWTLTNAAIELCELCEKEGKPVTPRQMKIALLVAAADTYIFDYDTTHPKQILMSTKHMVNDYLKGGKMQ